MIEGIIIVEILIFIIIGCIGWYLVRLTNRIDKLEKIQSKDYKNLNEKINEVDKKIIALDIKIENIYKILKSKKEE